MCGRWWGGWRSALVCAVALGVLALVTNVTTHAQLEGRDQEFAALRKSVTTLVNAGVVWAGLSILAGWLVRRPLAAALWGIGVGWISLGTHYALAWTTGVMEHPFADNWTWFVAASIFGAPLGLVGAATRRTDAWGVLARLVAPLGAVAEPWVQGWFHPMGIDLWTNRIAHLVAAWVLTIAGMLGVGWVLWRAASAGRVRRARERNPR